MATALSDIQATTYATIAGVIPVLGLVFAFGANVRTGQGTWDLRFRRFVLAQLVLMLAGEVVSIAALVFDRYSPIAHVVAALGVFAALATVVIEALIHLEIVDPPGGPRGRS